MPHAGGIYSYQFAMIQPAIAVVEFCVTSPKGDEITSVVGAMFDDAPLALDGTIALSDTRGWGLEIGRDDAELKRFAG